MSGRGDYSGGRGRGGGGGGRSGGGRDRGASDVGRGGGRSGGYDGRRGGGYEGGRGGSDYGGRGGGYGGRRSGYEGGRGGGGGYVGGRGGGHEGGRGGGGYEGGKGGGYEGGRGVGGYGGRGGGYEGGRRGAGGGGRGGGGRGEAWNPPPALVTLTTDEWAAARQTLEDHLRKLTVTPSKPKNEPPARPGFGKLGLPYRVTTNHLMVHFNVDQGHIHHYDVSIEPDVPSRKLNKDILTKLAITHKKDIGNIKFSYDGKKGLYTTDKLQFDSKDFVVRLTDNGPVRRERLFKVTIKYANAVDCSQLQEFLGGKLLESPQEIIQVYDVVLRSAKRLDDYVLVGRSLFSSALGCAYLADGLNYWQGFYQSLRPTQMGLTLNIDSSARAFYKPAHVIEFLGSLGIRLSNGTLHERERPKVKKALKGVTIEFTHREPRKKYKVIGISDQSAQKLKFSNSVGKQQSISEYFLEKYNISLVYPLLPCLEVGTSKKSISFPMEVCRIVDGQRYPKKLSEHQVSALLKATAVLPAKRACKILEMVARNDYDEDNLVKNFGLLVDNNFTSVNARVLPPPKLKYKGTNPAAIVEPSVGQWKMFKQKFIEGAYLKYWSIVSLSRNMNNAALTEFRNRLVQEFSKRGMVAELPLIENCVIPEGLEHFKGVLEDVQTKSNTRIRHEFRENCQLQLMVIILPDGYVDYYGHIKQICETELGIVSQCIRSEKALRAANFYIENVVLKINVKAGGRNTVLLDAFNRKIPLVSEEPTIIVGADVTHPQAGEDSSPSIAAVVASMDWPCNVKYRALVGAQPHRKEIINNLSVMVRELLHSFRISNEDALPRRIIFYRDGVSDGEFANVLLHEMIEMMKAFDSFGSDYRPAVTFIVVQKRHHTRLFSEDPNKTDRSGNVLPGTVVDNKICHPYQHDFYLCSHAGIQGTSKPTHYHVLHDENHFTADLLQLFTNSLCYTYARCTRSVSVVPPVYYAHLAAFRARHYVQGESYDTSSPSGGAGMSSRSNVGVVRPLPEIKENVKEVMFFC